MQQLPSELHYRIVLYLDARSLMRLSAASAYFNDLSKDEAIWQNLVTRKYDLVEPFEDQWFRTYQLVHSGVLRRVELIESHQHLDFGIGQIWICQHDTVGQLIQRVELYLRDLYPSLPPPAYVSCMMVDTDQPKWLAANTQAPHLYVATIARSDGSRLKALYETCRITDPPVGNLFNGLDLMVHFSPA